MILDEKGRRSMRTRDATVQIFDSASSRDAAIARGSLKFDAVKVRDATMAALGALRSRKRDADEHPGAHFVKAGVDFLHGDYPQNCEHAALTYHGPEMSLADAGNVMTSLGYERSSALTGRGETYSHPDRDDTIHLLSGPPAVSTRDADFSEEGSTGPSGGNLTSSEGSTSSMTGMQSSASTASADSGAETQSTLGGSTGPSTGGDGSSFNDRAVLVLDSSRSGPRKKSPTKPYTITMGGKEFKARQHKFGHSGEGDADVGRSFSTREELKTAIAEKHGIKRDASGKFA